MKISKTISVFLLIGWLLLSCCSCTPTFVYKYVIVLGVDGAGAFFEHAPTPNIDEIFAEYAYTYEMSAPSPTISAQCWGSMLHGVDPDKHQLTNESVETNEYDVQSPYPSVFKVLRNDMPNSKLASFCSWNPINTGIIENSIGVHKETVDNNNDALLTKKILAYLDEEDPPPRCCLHNLTL